MYALKFQQISNCNNLKKKEKREKSRSLVFAISCLCNSSSLGSWIACIRPGISSHVLIFSYCKL